MINRLRDRWLFLVSVVLIVTLLAFLYPFNRTYAVTETFTTAGASSWTAPVGVTSVQVECWGAGGSGGAGNGNNAGGGGGGGGGAYAIITSFSVTPGNTYSYTVGTGGAAGPGDGAAGTDSTFNSTTCVAQGGGGGLSASSGGTAGVAGSAAGSTGDTTYDGGSGGAGEGVNGGTGGGGGASAGTASAGSAGADGSAGGAGGTAVTDGGAGGAGGADGVAGTGGGTPGAGGGGGGDKSGASEDGGAGGDGQIRIVYTVDTTPPNPDPMFFATAPFATTSSAVEMTATTASDVNTPIQYYFEAVTGSCGADIGSGGVDSGWQTSTSYIDSGLEANKCYSYQVLARDGALVETATSTASSTYTRANIPGAVTFSSVAVTSFIITNNENGNPTTNPATTFAVYATSTDTAFNNVYITAAGGTSSSPVWLTDAQIDNTSVTGLTPETSYSFSVVARNNDNLLTASSTIAVATTPSDTTAPTPNPPFFTTAPDQTTNTAINMAAVSVTDDVTASPEYFFEAVAGSCGSDAGTGASNSGWQTSPVYSDSGLQTNRCYAYQITTRDEAGNYSATSTASSTYTAAVVPGALAFSGVANTSMVITNNENGNPTTNPATTFAVYATSTDTAFNNVYITAAGGTSSSPVWLTDAQIDNTSVTGLTPETSYSFSVVARNGDGDVTATSTLSATTTVATPDTFAPTPNPLTFEQSAGIPTDTSTASIAMTANTATDPASPVSYLFTNDNTACGADAGTGGLSSGWQVGDSTYTNTGLQVNQCYGYTVTARDALGNTGVESSASTTYTAANVPGALSSSASTDSSITIVNDANGNPTSNPVTTYAVYITTSAPSDPAFNNRYITAGGSTAATPVWLTDAQIDSLVIVGMQAYTSYTFEVVARNGDGDVTASSTPTSLYTKAEDLVRLQGIRLEGARLY